MKVCSGCNHEYEEGFKFCPECGQAWGAAARSAENAMNAHLRSLAVSAEGERNMELRKRFAGNITDAAKAGAEVLAAHDPLFASMVDDG